MYPCYDCLLYKNGCTNPEREICTLWAYLTSKKIYPRSINLLWCNLARFLRDYFKPWIQRRKESKWYNKLTQFIIKIKKGIHYLKTKKDEIINVINAFYIAKKRIIITFVNKIRFELKYIFKLTLNETSKLYVNNLFNFGLDEDMILKILINITKSKVITKYESDRRMWRELEEY